jgi:hypothetical protein
MKMNQYKILYTTNGNDFNMRIVFAVNKNAALNHFKLMYPDCVVSDIVEV